MSRTLLRNDIVSRAHIKSLFTISLHLMPALTALGDKDVKDLVQFLEQYQVDFHGH